MRGAMDKSSNHFKSWCPQAMERAKEIQESLSPEHPSFMKVMQRSHVSKPFYTSTPTIFCKKHLPTSDEMINFEVESGQTYKVKSLGMKCAFSGGWKAFAVAEKLIENDVLVFQLVRPCKFKVYIVRASGLFSGDKAPTVVKSDDFATQREVEKRTCERDKKSAKRVVGDVKEAHFIGVRKSLSSSGIYEAKINAPGRFDTDERSAREHRNGKVVTSFPLNRSPGQITTTVDSSPSSPKHHHGMHNVDRVRASGSCSTDKAPTVIEIDDFETERVEKKGTCERDKKRPRLVSLNSRREKVNDSSVKTSTCPSNSTLSNLDGSQPSEFVSDFTNFRILIGGTTIELPQQVRKAYFKLCRSRKSYLHGHLSKSMDRELAVSVISGTVTIANAIRGSKISTPLDDIAYWNKALDGFEIFGMNTGFLKARLNRLSGLTLNLKIFKELKIKRARVEEKIAELEEEKRRLDKEIESMRKIAIEHEVMYDEEANAPW